MTRWTTKEIRNTNRWLDAFEGRLEFLRDEGILAPGPVPTDVWASAERYADKSVRYDLKTGIVASEDLS